MVTAPLRGIVSPAEALSSNGAVRADERLAGGVPVTPHPTHALTLSLSLIESGQPILHHEKDLVACKHKYDRDWQCD